jgi:hypothetical protein
MSASKSWKTSAGRMSLTSPLSKWKPARSGANLAGTYGLGTGVDFVDGAIVWTIELEPAAQGTLFPTWHDPTDFETGMSIEAATALLVASPAGTTPETIDLSGGGDDLIGGMLLVGDQIMLGFQDGALVYVETVEGSTEGGGG